MTETNNSQTGPDLSVVVPVFNEDGNIGPLVVEIVAALADRVSYEIVYVDDASTDASAEALAKLAASQPALRIIRHRQRSGQSAAIHTGVRSARGNLIATLDGDGQNDPADIVKLLDIYKIESGSGDKPVIIAGNRTQRRDGFVKRISSKTANRVRAAVLGDQTPDTGCGLKVFRRDDFLALPAFDHMHRFLPALMLRHGGRVASVPVGHRPRERGESKYGIWDRLWIGISDVIAVAWLKRNQNVVRDGKSYFGRQRPSKQRANEEWTRATR